ncbi:MAG TPA: 2'-5' RNA ligase family protein [Chitinophagaceae bacterium]|nr:2'-5' RNA ligase family protein [Chitinophagaceae bacterium]
MKFIIRSGQITKTSWFFIALIPDRELRNKINPFRFDLSDRFESVEALKSPPHITIKNPFKCSGDDREGMLGWFSEMRLQQRPFHLYLNGFRAFPNKEHPVIFINPAMSNELIKMQRELITGFNSILPTKVHSLDEDFKPHMTVAYRDLTPENFSRAWQEYKDKPFYDVFDVHSIYLLEHDWKNWNIIATHKLG